MPFKTDIDWMRNIQRFYKLIGPDIFGPSSSNLRFQLDLMTLCAQQVAEKTNKPFSIFCSLRMKEFQFVFFPLNWIPQVAFIGQKCNDLFIFKWWQRSLLGEKMPLGKAPRVGTADLFRCSCSARCWPRGCPPVPACWSRCYKPESPQTETPRLGNIGDLGSE